MWADGADGDVEVVLLRPQHEYVKESTQHIQNIWTLFKKN
jgi:hypothetical protein